MQVKSFIVQRFSTFQQAIKLHPKLYLVFQALFIGWSMFWWWHPPTPGKAILLLAVVAAVVTIQPDMRDNHRLAWLVIIFLLFIVEFRALNRDRAEGLEREKSARAEENAKFSAILEEGRKHFEATLDENQRQFAEAMNRSERIITGVVDTQKMQTGGDSFAYITLTGPEPSILRFDKFSNPSDPWFLVSITSHGKYPLREIRATMMDDDRMLAAMQEYSKHPEGDPMRAIQSGATNYQYPYLRPQSAEAPSGEVEAIGTYPVPQGNSKRLSITFSSLNGYWNERLHLGLVNGQWHQCLSVLGPTVKQAINPFIWCDSHWPEGKALAEKDWRASKPLPRNR